MNFTKATSVARFILLLLVIATLLAFSICGVYINDDAQLHGIFDELRERLGITMLISTHCWDYVAHSADRVLEMDAGVVYLGPTEEWPRIAEARGEAGCTCSH